MYASQNGDTSMVKLLLKHGADAALKPENGYTALISAIRNGHLQTAEFLIRKGADINQPDNDQVTPLMFAVVADSFYLPDMLLYYDAEVNRQDNQGMNALMVASYHDRYEIAVSLLEAGAALNVPDKQGWTPLHYATMAGNTDIMELLIVNGASLEQAASSGYTPLSVATAMNNYRSARLLIGYGANVNSRINGSLNPLVLALESNNDSLVSMLRNQNARLNLWPSFNKYSTGANIMLNDDDMHLGFSFGLCDRKYNLMTGISYGYRLNAIQVLEQTNNQAYYQYWERRHFVALSAEKAIYLPTGFKVFKAGAFAGFSGILTYGGYRGSSENPDIRPVFNPRIGCILEYGFLRFKASYEYMNLHLRGVSTQWLHFSFELLFNRSRGNVKLPSPFWL
jgi:ankyrin repeat protein